MTNIKSIPLKSNESQSRCRHCQLCRHCQPCCHFELMSQCRRLIAQNRNSRLLLLFLLQLSQSFIALGLQTSEVPTPLKCYATPKAPSRNKSFKSNNFSKRLNLQSFEAKSLLDKSKQILFCMHGQPN